MSPDDRARLFDELPAKIVSRLLEQLSPANVTAQLWVMKRVRLDESCQYISLKEGFFY